MAERPTLTLPATKRAAVGTDSPSAVARDPSDTRAGDSVAADAVEILKTSYNTVASSKMNISRLPNHSRRHKRLSSFARFEPYTRRPSLSVSSIPNPIAGPTIRCSTWIKAYERMDSA